MHDGLTAAKQVLAQLQLDIQQIMGQAAADRKALADLKQTQQQQQQQSSIPASIQGPNSAPAGAASATIDQDMAAQLHQLPLLLLRLATVEQALAGMRTNSQPAAVGRSASSSSGASRHATAVALEPGSTADGSAAASLAAQVASLQAQVSQLVQARAAATRSNSNRTPPVPALLGNSGQLEAPLHALSTPAATEGSSYADADAGCAQEQELCMDNTSTAAEGAGVGDAGEGVVAALAELSGRVLELQAQLEGLAAGKADRGELERLRGLLAETAAQVGRAASLSGTVVVA
jgi:hypothetical protein